MLTAAVGDRCQLVGDDLFVHQRGDPRARASRRRSANAILIKVNQIGTLTETFEAIELARAAGYNSHHLAPLRRDRGHVHRRPRGGDGRRADQDRARRRAPIAWRSTTSCCASRSSWAARPSIRAARSSASEAPPWRHVAGQCEVEHPRRAVLARSRWRWAVAVVALIAVFALQGGEYGTSDLLAAHAAPRVARPRGEAAAGRGRLAATRQIRWSRPTRPRWNGSRARSSAW